MEALISNKPFFILGSQRSGTTMLRLMLNNHSNLSIPHETGFFIPVLEKLRLYGDLSIKSNLKRLLLDIADYPLVKRGGHITDLEKILEKDVTTFPQLIDAIMSDYAHARGKIRWGDKTPFYTTYIDQIWSLFPGCKIIHLVRDGRDVALSQRKIEWCSNSLPRLALDWSWKTQLCHKVGAVLGDDHFLELKYENLVMNPEDSLKKICLFLGETYEPKMNEYHEEARMIVPSESLKWHQNSIASPNEKKIYSWKSRLSKSDVIIFEQMAGDALRLFNYETYNLKTTLGSKFKSLYYSTVVRW